MNSTRVLLWNARGFGNKKEEISYKMHYRDVTIGILTEIKQSSIDWKKKNNNLSISGYNVIVENNYRQGRRGAGKVAVLVKKEFDIRKIEIDKKTCNRLGLCNC